MRNKMKLMAVVAVLLACGLGLITAAVYRPSAVSTGMPGVEMSRGAVFNAESLAKFGLATDVDNGVETDVWDGADGVTSTDVWVAPTAARVHALVSSSIADDKDSGTGMRKVRIYGLPDWDTAEVSEDVELDGLTPVNTVNSYVIIHRMKGLEFGSGGTNAGIVKATAATDSTVTAAIQAGRGQTLMAIYGVPSTQNLYIENISASALKSTGSTPFVDGSLLVKENADTATSGFLTKWVFNISGAENYAREFPVPLRFEGPCIVKLHMLSDTDNTQVAGDFSGVMITE